MSTYIFVVFGLQPQNPTACNVFYKDKWHIKRFVTSNVWIVEYIILEFVYWIKQEN